MKSPDEFIDSGFAAIKNAQPSRTPADLTTRVRRQERRARIVKASVGAAGCMGLVGMFAISMRPTSALAALTEAARLSAAQPIIHLRLERNDPPDPTRPLWLPSPPSDIWKFHDRYIRHQGHDTYEAFKEGKALGYDDRFPTGVKVTYNASKDRFWTFDGTISEELAGAHRNPPVVKTVDYRGASYFDYEWDDSNSMEPNKTAHVYVDPQSKFVRFSKQELVLSDGSVSRSLGVVDYPSAEVAERDMPRFPAGLIFKTNEEILKEFNRMVSHPDQTKTLGGIRTTLYCVVIHPNIPDGVGVDVITRGGAGPDYGSGHAPEVEGLKLLPVKRHRLLPPLVDPNNVRDGGNPVIGGQKYVVNQSNDLLVRAPTRITVRVPVWRLSPTTFERDGKTFHVHTFVGYVTFTTSKLFYNTGDSDLNLHNYPMDRP